MHRGLVFFHQGSEAPKVQSSGPLLPGVYPRPALVAAEDTSVSRSSEILLENLICEKILLLTVWVEDAKKVEKLLMEKSFK